MERIVVARILRAHGLAGGLYLRVETDSPGEVLAEGRVLGVRDARPGLPASLTVAASRPHGRGWLLEVEEIPDRTFAEHYAGSYLTLPREELPALGADEYFIHDLLGLEVLDEERGSLGAVFRVYEAPGGPLLAVRVEGRERLIPFRRETVRGVELSGGKLRVRLPSGLLEAQGTPGRRDSDGGRRQGHGVGGERRPGGRGAG